MKAQEHTAWKYSWHQRVGMRPTKQNEVAFQFYVEMAYKLLEEFNSADFLYSEVREMCNPAYLFQVVCDMTEYKLSMKVHTTESGLKCITIHKVG